MEQTLDRTGSYAPRGCGVSLKTQECKKVGAAASRVGKEAACGSALRPVLAAWWSAAAQERICLTDTFVNIVAFRPDASGM